MGEHVRGIFFYLPVMLTDLFPWSLFIPLALFWAFRQRSNRVVRLLLICIAAIVVFFSLSGTKEDLYILPIVPAEAALIGAVIAGSFDRLTTANSARWFSVATAVVLFLTGAVGLWVFAISHRYSLQGASLVAVVAVIGGAVALVAGARRQIFAAASTVAGTLVVILWCVVLSVLPDFERYKPVRPFADIIRSRASVGGIVGYYGFALPSMVYYLHRPIMEVVLSDHLRATFYSTSDVHFVMPEAAYEAVKERLPVRTYVLARQPMFDLRPRNFLQGSELPQFVLISNRSGDAAK
jgi:4-amino-4-deoxy-L-arabinose transferase-like glycosyltransferase